MTNEEFSAFADAKCIELTQLRAAYIQLAKGILGKTLLQHDLYYCANINRAIQLIDGFKMLLKERNLICVSAIVRLQIDNCARTVAPLIAENEQDVFDAVVNGTRIDNIKAKGGGNLSDKRLVDFLSKYDKQIKTVYQSTSGAIHFSEKAFYACVSAPKDKEYQITLNVGNSLEEKCNEPLKECAEAFCHYICFHQKFLEMEADWKAEFEKTNNSVLTGDNSNLDGETNPNSANKEA